MEFDMCCKWILFWIAPILQKFRWDTANNLIWLNIMCNHSPRGNYRIVAD